MNVDIIGQDVKYNFFTIGDLLNVAKAHPSKLFRFCGTDFYVGDLMSWRGSYYVPAIDYSTREATGREVFKDLTEALKRTHEGFKGGEFRYKEVEQFYVSGYGEVKTHKVFHANVFEELNEVVLLTRRAIL